MDTVSLEKHFRRIGSRFRVGEAVKRRWNDPEPRVRLDVVNDRFGECFELQMPTKHDADAYVVNVASRDRHLLMVIREAAVTNKLLCGHDERHWFVAGLPDFAKGAGTVQAAKNALKPQIVRNEEIRKKLSLQRRNRRRNEVFLRQGEWFFLPMPDMKVDPRFILFNEPLSRGAGSKPHRLQECTRWGGETVYICGQHPLGITEREYEKLLSRKPNARSWGWTIQRRNPAVFARGRIRHADHATICLPVWHQVVMNTEGQSAAMRFVAFLD